MKLPTSFICTESGVFEGSYFPSSQIVSTSWIFKVHWSFVSIVYSSNVFLNHLKIILDVYNTIYIQTVILFREKIYIFFIQFLSKKALLFFPVAVYSRNGKFRLMTLRPIFDQILMKRFIKTNDENIFQRLRQPIVIFSRMLINYWTHAFWQPYFVWFNLYFGKEVIHLRLVDNCSISI